MEERDTKKLLEELSTLFQEIPGDSDQLRSRMITIAGLLAAELKAAGYTTNRRVKVTGTKFSDTYMGVNMTDKYPKYNLYFGLYSCTDWWEEPQDARQASRELLICGAKKLPELLSSISYDMRILYTGLKEAIAALDSIGAKASKEEQ